MEPAKMQKLQDLLNSGDDWAKLEVSDGVFVTKMPGKGRFKAKLALEINTGARKSLYVTTLEKFNAYAKIFADPSVLNLMETINGMESGKEPAKSDGGEVIGKL